jgi:signal transduction histidine kinase
VLGDRVVALQLAAVAAAIGAGTALREGLSSTRRHGTLLAARLAETSVDADARQDAVAELVVNLARRSQSLVDRQLALIDDMEQTESEPDALGELFQLDHLATRIRRHAESLLVLAGDESPSRSWRRPVLLTEVVRAAAAEVEDYRRVDVLVGDDVEVTGRVVADLAHLLAELIENATTYSPIERRVEVRSHTEPSGDATRPSVVLVVEDSGIGMTDADRAAANRVLAEPMVLDMRGHTMGMHVVARLAHRYGLGVRLDPTAGGGTTALVTLPAELVSGRDPSRPPRPARPARRPHFTPIPAAGGAPSTFTPTRPTAAPAPSLPVAPTRPAAPTFPVAPVAPHPATPSAPVAPIVPVPVAPATPAAPAAAGPPPGGVAPGSGPAHEHGHSTVDREHVRSMLSRFQASQRAGRALADAPPGSLAPAPTPATAPRPVQEDS